MAGSTFLPKSFGGFLIRFVRLQIPAQLFPVEDIDTHGSQVAFGNLGLLVKLVDGIVWVGVENAEAGSLLHRDFQHRDGAVGVVFLMLGDHLRIVHFIDVVAGQDQHVIGIVPLDKGNVLINGVGRALVPVGAPAALVGGQHMHAAVHGIQVPGLAGSDVFIEHHGLVLGEDPHRLNPGIDAVGKRKVDDPVFAAVGHRRLCQILGQNAQTAALPARQQHCHTFLLAKHRINPPLWPFLQE